MRTNHKPSDNGNPSRFSIQTAGKIRNRIKDNNDHVYKATPASLCGGSPGVRKQKIFLVIEINNESVIRYLFCGATA